MTKTFADLQAQIQSLQAQAEKQRLSEIADVVARMRADIQTYGITAQQLFGRAAGAKVAGKAPRAAKTYSDGQGNTWGGRGPRPQWLRSALAAGHQLEEFAVSGSPTPPKAAPKAARKAAGKAAQTADRTAAPARKSRAPKATATKKPRKSTAKGQGRGAKKAATSSASDAATS